MRRCGAFDDRLGLVRDCRRDDGRLIVVDGVRRDRGREIDRLGLRLVRLAQQRGDDHHQPDAGGEQGDHGPILAVWAEVRGRQHAYGLGSPQHITFGQQRHARQQADNPSPHVIPRGHAPGCGLASGCDCQSSTRRANPVLSRFACQAEDSVNASHWRRRNRRRRLSIEQAPRRGSLGPIGPELLSDAPGRAPEPIVDRLAEAVAGNGRDVDARRGGFVGGPQEGEQIARGLDQIARGAEVPHQRA